MNTLRINYYFKNTTKKIPLKFLLIVKLLNAIIFTSLIYYFFLQKSLIISFSIDQKFDYVIGLMLGILIFFISKMLSRLIKVYSKRVKLFKVSSIKQSILPNNLMFSIVISLYYTTTLAILEEIIFRSILIDFLLNYFSVINSIILSSVVFAILHFNMKILQLFVIGLLLAISLFITDNLLTPIVAHITNNIMVVIYFSWFQKNEK